MLIHSSLAMIARMIMVLYQIFNLCYKQFINLNILYPNHNINSFSFVKDDRLDNEEISDIILELKKLKS